MESKKRPKRRQTNIPNVFIGRDGTFYFRGMINGIPYEEPLIGATNRTTARDKAREFVASKKGVFFKSKKSVYVSEVYKRFDEIQSRLLVPDGQSKVKGKKQIREKTLKDQQHFFEKHLLPFFGNYSLKKLEKDFLLSLDSDQHPWNRYVQEKKIYKSPQGKPIQLKNHRQAFAKFLKWIYRERLIQIIPHELPIEDRPPKKVKAPNKLEALLILKYSSEDLFLFLLMYLTMAMRKTEILKARVDHINIRANAYELADWEDKNDKGRVIPFNSLVWEIVSNRIKRQASPYIFPNRKDSQRPATGFKRSFTTAKRLASERLLQKANRLRLKLENSKALTQRQVDLLALKIEHFENLASRVQFYTPHEFRKKWVSEAHTAVNITNMEREKFAGSSTKVQGDRYVELEAKKLRRLAHIVRLPGLESLASKKIGTWGKLGDGVKNKENVSGRIKGSG